MYVCTYVCRFTTRASVQTAHTNVYCCDCRVHIRGCCGIDPGVYLPFAAFDVSRFPNGPSKTNTKVSVRETMRQLFKFQGIFVPPDDVAADVVDDIVSHLSTKVRVCVCGCGCGWVFVCVCGCKCVGVTVCV